MKLVEVYNAWGALQELGRKELPIKLSYAVIKNVKEMKKHFEVAEEIRTKMVLKYKDPKAEKVADDKVAVFNKEFNEFINDVSNSVDVEAHKISVKEFEKEKISPMVLMALEFMIVE
jgi:hypothetical protein